MKSGLHQMMKDCPNCPETNETQTPQKNKDCSSLECTASCSASISMNSPTGISATFQPIAHTVETARLLNDRFISFLTQTQERPPRQLA